MRYNISTLILILVLASIACGWIVERRHYDANLENAGSFGYFTAMAYFTNEYFTKLDSLGRNELDRHRKNQMVLNVLYLFRNRSNALAKPYNQMESFASGLSPRQYLLAETKRSLDLLEISDPKTFGETYLAMEREMEWMMQEQYRNDIFDKNSDHPNEAFSNFILEAIAVNDG